MNKLVKRIIGATSACALVVGMVLGANALAKKGEVKVVEKKKAETMVTFHYEAPTIDPYTATSVKDVSNWKEAKNQCPLPTAEEIPCSIQVLSSKVVGTPGTPSLSATISPTVSIETDKASPSTPNQHIVTPSTNSDYENEVNRAL